MDSEAALLRERDRAALLAVARARGEAGEVERPSQPRRFTEARDPLWKRVEEVER